MLEEVPGVPSSDIRINNVLGDFKSTKGAGNIVKYAHKAVKVQGADVVLFEFANRSVKLEEELEKLRKEGVKGFYYYLNDGIIHKL